MGAGLLAAAGVAALVRSASGLWAHGGEALRGAMEQVRPSLRFYLGEPVWWHPGWSLGSIARTSGCAVLVSSCSATLSRLIDPENSFALGFWLGCTAAALLLWACALGAAGALGFWFLAWALRNFRRRARCRRILRANGWPRVLISPRLLEFSDEVWGRLPPHEHFALTPWGSEWRGKTTRPLHLFAALALADELHRASRDSEEEPEETAAGRVRNLVSLLERGRRAPEDNAAELEPENSLKPIPQSLWLEVLLQPLGGSPASRRGREDEPRTRKEQPPD